MLYNKTNCFVFKTKCLYLQREFIPKVFRKCSDCATDCKYTKNFRYNKVNINKNMVMKSRRVIQLPRGKAEMMMKSLGIGRTTLYAALNGTSQSDDAKRTRHLAITKYGGVEYSKPIV